jgi:hypothetical protein
MRRFSIGALCFVIADVPAGLDLGTWLRCMSVIGLIRFLVRSEQESGVRENRLLRLMWRGLETGSRRGC